MAVYNGTSGNDVYTGTSAADTINGFGGNDQLRGGGGNDTIYGGGGFPRPSFDRIWGDAGDDTIYLGQNASGNIAYGGDDNDRIYGGASSDDIYGDAGNDFLYTGGLQNGSGDRLYGGIGNDTLTMDAYASGDTTLDGGIGDDTFSLTYGLRTFLTGGAGNDIFNVNALTWSENHFNGGSEYDTIRATANGSRLGLSSITGIEEISANGFTNFTIELYQNTAGGPTAPTIDLSKTLLTGVASIAGTLQGDTIYLAGSFVGDTASQTSNDTVNAGYGNDVVHGGFGIDTLNGEDGDDFLSGGSGNDGLAGGAGADTFLFSVDYDQDVIADFVSGTDKIRLEGLLGFDDFTDVQAVMSMSGTDTLIDFGNGDILQLTNVVSSSLTAGDFIFA